ncbi:protein unc-93 homolog A-like [Physella acuta]|uniref:protein unc-93 homolog A-like n=1 Tax=Physella acuta TaxID=109671 RepID=UPI0027DC83EE|nr:protein unc-93 homolog A-like [Physella acuta]XP_059140325.1 protein unc-93 homolog A-like [Physella acuta]
MELVQEEDEEPEVKPNRKRVNFRKEMLRYQSLRNHINESQFLAAEEDDLEDKDTNIWRNFVSQCSATFLAVFAVIPSRNLQTSIHAPRQLGKISLVCMYVCYIVGCLFTAFILRKVKAKTLLLASLFFHILYSVSNVIPSAYTLLPSSCLVGLCQPAFWAVQDMLLLNYGLKYSASTRMTPQKSLRLFQTVTIITIHSAQILGNLLSSGLISVSQFHCSEDWMMLNTSRLPDSHPDRFMRADKWTYTLPFIPIQARRSTEASPPVNFYQLLTLIYLCMSVVAMGAVLIFFESPDTVLQRRVLSWRERVKEIGQCCTDPRWLLAWFSAAYVGFAQGVIMCDITKLYGTDTLGCFIVGYMMVSFGTGNLVAILAMDKLKPCSSHPLFLSLGFLMNIGVLILTSLWKPTSSESSELLLYTAFWGLADGTLQAQSQAIVTRYAREEKDTAMTGFRVCQGLGLIASFFTSIFTQNLMTSLYAALVLHVIGFLGLILVANEVANRDRHGSDVTDESHANSEINPNMAEAGIDNEAEVT